MLRATDWGIMVFHDEVASPLSAHRTIPPKLRLMVDKKEVSLENIPLGATVIGIGGVEVCKLTIVFVKDSTRWATLKSVVVDCLYVYPYGTTVRDQFAVSSILIREDLRTFELPESGGFEVPDMVRDILEIHKQKLPF